METEFVIPVYNYLDKQLDKLYENIYTGNNSQLTFRRRSKGRTIEREKLWSKNKGSEQKISKCISEKTVEFSNQSTRRTDCILESTDNVDEAEFMATEFVIPVYNYLDKQLDKLYENIYTGNNSQLTFRRRSKGRTIESEQKISKCISEKTVEFSNQSTRTTDCRLESTDNVNEDKVTALPIEVEDDSDTDSNKSGIISTHQRKDVEQESGKRKVEKVDKHLKHSHRSHRDSRRSVDTRDEIQDYEGALGHRKLSHYNKSRHEERRKEKSQGNRFTDRISISKKYEKGTNPGFDHKSNEKAQKTKNDSKSKEKSRKYYHREHRGHDRREERDKYQIRVRRDRSKHKIKSDEYRDRRHHSKDLRKEKSNNECKENHRSVRTKNKEKCDTKSDKKCESNFDVKNCRNIRKENNDPSKKCESNCEPKYNDESYSKNACYRNYRSEKHMRTRGVVKITEEKQKRAKELTTIEQKVQDQILQNHETHAGVKNSVYDCLEDFDDRIELIEDIEDALPKSHVTEWSNGERQYNLTKSNQLKQVFHNGGIWKSITQEKV